MRYYLALLLMVVLTAYGIYLAVSNGGKRLGVVGKVVKTYNKATDALSPDQKRTRQAARKQKIKDKEKDDELSFAKRFEPQMAVFQASLAED